jgi:phage tail-like protein
MTQAISPPTLNAQILSMNPVETLEGTPSALVGSVTEQLATDTLLLHPEEVSQVLVSITNASDRPLTWDITVSGDYPEHWYREYEVDSKELAPYQAIDIPLRFQVPDNVLEAQNTLNNAQPRLRLSYRTEVTVYQVSATGHHSIAYKSLLLQVRPRTFYLDFLPDFYREMDFFGRFLAIFEQTFDSYIQTLDVLWAHLDPLTAPQSLLPFLAHWVAWHLDSNLDINRQRYLIRNALELYRWHGTRKGLCFYLHLYTDLPLDDHHIRIEEIFSGGFAFGNCCLGQDAMLGGGRPYHFVVHLHSDHPDYPINEHLVRTIIEREKPPFCTYDLSIN